MKPKKILLLVVIALVIGGIYYIEQGKVKPPKAQESQAFSQESILEKTGKPQPLLKDGKYPLAPELVGISGYLNTEEGLKVSDLRGKVVIIDFWTYTCINCIRTFPFLKAWDEKYRDKGLVIIGVHTPEFEFEKIQKNVQNAMDKYELKYPVVQDNDYLTWRAYKNRFWPHKYLIDSEGYIRYDHIGEGAYEETERVIQELLGEIGSDVDEMGLTDIEEKTPTERISRELYAGYRFALPRGQDLGNKGGFERDQVSSYQLPDRIGKDIVYVLGDWLSTQDELEAKSEGSIVLDFTATSVNIVANPILGAIEMEVLINGEPISEQQAGEDVIFKDGKGIVVIDKPLLYNVFDGEYGRYRLELKVDKGFSFTAFTFG